MHDRMVAVSYGADDATRKVNVEVLGDLADVVFLRDVPSPERADVVGRADVLLSWTMSREFDPAAMGALSDSSRLGMLQLGSAGVDHVDLGAVPPQALIASNAGAYAAPMAEHVMAMTLALAKWLPQRHAALAQGRWEQTVMSRSLVGAVCGIVGFGGIGRATARLMRPFGARIWALNTTGETDEDVEFIGTLMQLDDLLEHADVVVLSVPLTRATKGLFGSRELGLMKPEAILVNVARGEIVEEKALYEHLCDHRGFCAGIDTWWHEPLHHGSFQVDHRFLELPNVIGSPHNSAMVPGILNEAARRAAENVARYLTGGEVRGAVRREDYL